VLRRLRSQLREQLPVFALRPQVRRPVRGWVEGIFDYRAGELPALLTRAPAAPLHRTV
jgi:hypothetical protein